MKNKKIAFVRVPKTASSAIVQKNVDDICPGVLNLKNNDRCYVNHKFKFHYGGGNYCIFFNNFSQHVSSSVYNNLENHDHLFYTQLRDPYDVACSLYFFLKNGNEKTGMPVSIIGSNIDTDYHNSQLVSNNISINEFLENMMHNQTYVHYYDDLNIKDFDCIGLSNDIKKTKKLFEKIFNVKIDTHVTNNNINKKLNEPYNFKFNRTDFKKLNEQEYEIFYEGIKKFNNLCNKYL